MRLRTRAIAYGISGLVLAGAVIFSGSTLGLLGTGSSGVLSVLLTDPPMVPNGVSAVYITYSAIQVHANGFGDAGWVTVSGAGTIDAMRLINLSQTISSGTVPSLTYDLVRLEISGASVQFMGRNYTADVSSGELTVSFAGGLKVNSSTASAALIDLQPTVLNLGTQSEPEFNLAAGARALQVPSTEVSESIRTVGHTFGLPGQVWYESFKMMHSGGLTITGLALTGGSLSFSAANNGADAVTLRMVVITPASGAHVTEGVPSSVANGAVFVAESDGSLKLLGGNPMQAGSMSGGSGYSLASGSTHQFAFTGTISTLLEGGGIVKGASYNVVVVGSGTVVTQTVVAG